MDILELSELQILLFDLEDETVEETCSAIVRSNYFNNQQKLHLLLSNISLLIELRPNKIDQIINLCSLINKVNRTNFFSIRLFQYLLIKLSQEHQYFIFKAYHSNIYTYYLIDSTLEYLLNSSQKTKAYKLARWFSNELSQKKSTWFNQMLSFNFINAKEGDLLKSKKRNDFLLKKPSSKLESELQLYEILRNDSVEQLQSSINQFTEILTKRKHFFSIDSIYSHFVESTILLDEKLSVFDICAYYDSIDCFEYLYSLVERNNDSSKLNITYLQSISKEKEKSFNVLHYAIAGGSISIILSLIDHKFPMDNCIQCAIYFHRNDLVDFFSEITSNILVSPKSVLNSISNIWETPLFQSCHTNNIETFLQILNCNTLQDGLCSTLPSLSYSSNQNPFFYNIDLYLYIYDNIIKARDSIKLNEDEKENNCLFDFKNEMEAESSLSSLFSLIKHTKGMLLFNLFYLCKKGYNELLQLFINEMVKTSKSIQKILDERSTHECDATFQFPFNINATDKYDNTLLIIASKYNQISCVKSLLRIQQILHDLDETDEEYVIDNINVNLINNEGRSALDYACFNCNFEIAKEILASGLVSIENLHKSLISCLRSYSYYNDKYDAKLEYKRSLYGFMFPSYFNRFYPNAKKILKNDSLFENIIGLILNTLKETSSTAILDSSSSEDKNQISFSMYHKSIEKYSIKIDNVEIFNALLNTPEGLKSLSDARCLEIIIDVIEHNSINILKYIFGDSKEGNPNLDDCPITYNMKFNFLAEAIKKNRYDSARYLFSLNIFDLEFNDVFDAIKYPHMLYLIYEFKPKIIISNINEQGKNKQTLLTQCARENLIESFRFLMNNPAVNINSPGLRYDPINESYANDCNEIFVMCVKHPTINMKLSSFSPYIALEVVIGQDDDIAAKAILEKRPDTNIVEPISLASKYSFLNDYSNFMYSEYRKKDSKASLMRAATEMKKKRVLNYFKYYIKKNNITYSEKKIQQSYITKPSIFHTETKEPVITELEQSIIDDDFEKFKQLTNKDNINVHFERTGMTPLSTVIQKQDINMVKHLLSFPEIDINLINQKPKISLTSCFNNNETSFNSFSLGMADTPLIEAISVKNLEIVKILLSNPSIDVNKQSGRGTTPLSQAIKMNSKLYDRYYMQQAKESVSNQLSSDKKDEISASQAIIFALLDKDDLDINQESSSTKICPLMDAISSNQVETVRRMVELFSDDSHNKKHKLNYGVKNFIGRTPLIEAKDKPEILKLIESKCPDRDQLNSSNQLGWSSNWALNKQNNNFSSKAKYNKSARFNYQSADTTNMSNTDLLKELTINEARWNQNPSTKPNKKSYISNPVASNLYNTNPFMPTINKNDQKHLSQIQTQNNPFCDTSKIYNPFTSKNNEKDKNATTPTINEDYFTNLFNGKDNNPFIVQSSHRPYSNTSQSNWGNSTSANIKNHFIHNNTNDKNLQ